jgi:hypothetical protein
MPVKPELAEQHAQQTVILAALKAALPSAADADIAAEIQNQIEIYESALADPAYQDDFDPSRDPTAVELIIGKVSGLSDPTVRWHAEIAYKPGDVCTHSGTVYRALADVAVGTQPDDVFDAEAGTGGWIPVDYEPPVVADDDTTGGTTS